MSKKVSVKKKINSDNKKKSFDKISIDEGKKITKKKARCKYFSSSIFNKQNIVCLCLFLVDVLLIIYFARNNIANYVKINEKDIFVGETRSLLLGRNYITVIMTVFFSVYTLALQRFFFKRKVTMKYLVFIFLFYLIFNLVLFYLFTKRVY